MAKNRKQSSLEEMLEGTSETKDSNSELKRSLELLNKYEKKIEELTKENKELKNYKQKIESKEPTYFSKKEDIPKELYNLTDVKDIFFSLEVNEINLDYVNGNINISISKELIVLGNRYDPKLDFRLMCIKENLIEKARKYTKNKGYNGFLVDKNKINIKNAVSGEHSNLLSFTKYDLKYDAEVIAKLYIKNEKT